MIKKIQNLKKKKLSSLVIYLNKTQRKVKKKLNTLRNKEKNENYKDLDKMD